MEIPTIGLTNHSFWVTTARVWFLVLFKLPKFIFLGLLKFYAIAVSIRTRLFLVSYSQATVGWSALGLTRSLIAGSSLTLKFHHLLKLSASPAFIIVLLYPVLHLQMRAVWSASKHKHLPAATVSKKLRFQRLLNFCILTNQTCHICEWQPPEAYWKWGIRF